MVALALKRSKNNIFFVLSNRGRVLYHATSGSLGLRGASRVSRSSLQIGCRQLVLKCFALEIRDVRVFLIGNIDSFMRMALVFLRKNRLQFRVIVIKPNVAHNGVKLRKKRRV